MRTVCWVSLALLVLPAYAAAQNTVALPSGGSLRYSSDDSQTRIEIGTRRGKLITLRLERDGFVLPGAVVVNLRILGELENRAIVLADTYPSKPGGMSFCQAGEERFLRVISIARTPASETLRLKLESCRENIELGSPGLEWQQAPPTLRIHWLLGPSKPGQPEERVIRIGPHGLPQ